MSLTKRWLYELNEAEAPDMPVIYAYTDADALADGALVNIESLGLTFEDKPINRITAALFWQEQPNYPLVDFDEAADADAINFNLEAYGKLIAGQLPDAGGSDYLRTLPGNVWLVENETGGWTLMLPSDY